MNDGQDNVFNNHLNVSKNYITSIKIFIILTYKHIN